MSNLPTKTIYCLRSGLPLLQVSAVCSQGWPMLSSLQTTFIHPIYAMPLDGLLRRTVEQLARAQLEAWTLPPALQEDMALTMSATMHCLGAIWWLDSHANLEPSLPAWPVVIGSMSRLYALASWYHYGTSKRIGFPLYHISHKNSNAKWENFSAWLDDAFTLKEEWQSKKEKLATEDLLRSREAALKQIKSEHIYKRIDFAKVWNWIDIQVATNTSRYPAGRRETFKQLFMTGDQAPEEWLQDDVEDLQFAITECCDVGNEITHFINARLNNIKAMIQDFYGSFTLLNTPARGGDAHPDATQTKQEEEFFATFDARIASMDAIPAEPKRESFASLGLFMKAKAQHSILTKRFALLATHQAAQQQGE